MKRLFTLFCIITASSLFAFEPSMFEDNQAVEDALIMQIKNVQAPLVIGDYILFTASGTARHAGIVFDFENYRNIHSFKRLMRRIPDTEKTESDLLFYALKIPHNVRLIKYRLIVDGLWTTDPANPAMEFSSAAHLNVSVFAVDKPIEKRTSAELLAKVRFIYQGESGQKIRVGGTFTNWDSFIYELQEIRPGFYQLELPLPKGEYYYSYYKGMNAFADTTNPHKVYTSDGRTASVLYVR